MQLIYCQSISARYFFANYIEYRLQKSLESLQFGINKNAGIPNGIPARNAFYNSIYGLASKAGLAAVCDTSQPVAYIQRVILANLGMLINCGSSLGV